MRRLKIIIGVMLCICLTACGEPVKDSSEVDMSEVTAEAGTPINSTITKLKECRYEIQDALGTVHGRYAVYKDTVTNSTFVRFYYQQCLIPLVTSDGNLKPYCENDTNELTLIEQGAFLVFEDADTNVQYIVTNDLTDYIVRLPSERKGGGERCE